MVVSKFAIQSKVNMQELRTVPPIKQMFAIGFDSFQQSARTIAWHLRGIVLEVTMWLDARPRTISCDLEIFGVIYVLRAWEVQGLQKPIINIRQYIHFWRVS